jgi:hypothetical protein
VLSSSDFIFYGIGSYPTSLCQTVDPLFYCVVFLNLMLVKCVNTVKIFIIPAKKINVPT